MSPRVGLELAGDDAQERRLAGAVSADQRHPVARPHDRRDVAQDLVRSERQRHGRDVQGHSRIMPAMIGLFPTCLGDAVHPQVVRDTERVLGAAGVATVSIPGATCCGQPAWNSGFAADARRVARRTLRAMAGLDAIVVPSGSCTAMMRLHWRHLFHGDRDQALAERTAGRVFELSQYLVEEVGSRVWGRRWAAPSPTTTRVTCCASCACTSSRAGSCARSPTYASCRAATAAAGSAGCSRCAARRRHRDGRRQARIGGGRRRPDGRRCRPRLHHARRGRAARTGADVRVVHLATILAEAL